MPWSLNPLSAKQKAQDRKATSRADYSNKQNLADSDAAELPGGATVQGFNADRRSWKVGTKNGTVYAPSLTPGATADAAFVPGAGLVPRESLPATPVSAPVPAILDEEAPPASVGFGMLYLLSLRSQGGQQPDSVRLLWTHNQALHTVVTGGDVFLDPTELGLGFSFRCFALSESQALVIAGRNVPATVVPPSGARRLSIWLMNSDGTGERENHQWLFNQDGSPFDWASDDAWARFKPATRTLLTSITTNTTLYSQVEADFGLVNGPYSGATGVDGMLKNQQLPYAMGQGGYNEDEEYLELPNFLLDYGAFQVPELIYPGTSLREYPALFNLFSADSRDVYKAASPTEFEVVGTIAKFASLDGIQGIVLAENTMGNYYLYGRADTAEGSGAQTSFNRIGEMLGNSEVLEEYKWFVSNTTGDFAYTLNRSNLIPVFNNSGEGLLIVVERGYTYEILARKPYRTSTPEPES